MEKYKSRKFLLAVAAALASIGTGIAGLVTDNQTVATVGIICTIASSALYAFAEALVDAAAVGKERKDEKKGN